ncbi:MAG: hypothetical protein JXA71_20235 [Chitinispirillaceae bacterium]|nr:hypothetical protein [Chitinispirillaceae bacterium]
MKKPLLPPPAASMAPTACTAPGNGDSGTSRADGRADCMAIAILMLLTAIVFQGTLRNDFVYYDDNVYITENPHIRKGLTLDALRWSLTSFYAGNWHPLT